MVSIVVMFRLMLATVLCLGFVGSRRVRLV